MKKIVLLRHGESTWNQENRFTGWADVDLTAKGVEEGRAAGRLFAKEGYDFDLTFTSVLKRAVRTLNLALEEMDRVWLPVVKDWHLNERHYGGLQGLDKSEMAAKFGEEQVLVWRRSYDTRPPDMPEGDARDPTRDRRYAGLKGGEAPRAECLKDTVERVIPYWNASIAPRVAAGERVLIVAHGNSLRAMVKYFDAVSDAQIVSLNIPTGVPLVYELDEKLKPLRHYYLGDQDAIARSIAAVANQGKAR